MHEEEQVEEKEEMEEVLAKEEKDKNIWISFHALSHNNKRN